MDSFVEQIIKKKFDRTDLLVIVASSVGALVFLAAVFLIGLYVPFIVYLIAFFIVGIGYALWWIISCRSKEYEYSVTNGDIDIDCIIARRKRQRVVSVRGAKIQSLLPFTPDIAARPFDRRVMVAPSPEEATWCFTYHSKKNGNTLVMFAPDERVQAALYQGLQKTVQMETDRKQKGL